MPTSAEINAAIETLRAASVGPHTMGALDRWNAARMRIEAEKVTSREDVVRLLDGISGETLARAGIT